MYVMFLYLLCVGLVPLADLHEPLVRPQPGVRWSNSVLQLIQLTRKPARRALEIKY